MKKLYTICLLTLLFGCSEQAKSDKTFSPTRKSSTKEMETKTTDYLISTYDNPAFVSNLKSHRETLQQLSQKNVFSIINAALIQELDKKHRDYFNIKSNYELLFVAKGDLFQENKTDCAFIVYDREKQRISILIHNEMTNQYAELFREINVRNGLQTADCNYSAFGTLDYQIADEIIQQEANLLEKPESYLETIPCKIVNISQDEDFVLESGCFSAKASQGKSAHSLCIATSDVYNNWECLNYDKATNSFLIFYGQAFAD